MKTNKLLFPVSIGIIGMFLLMGFVANPKSDDFILLRTIEAHAAMNITKSMIVSRSDGSTEYFELQNIDKNTDKAVANLKDETAKIKEILAQGYELKNFSGGGSGNGIVYTYMFTKK